MIVTPIFKMTLRAIAEYCRSHDCNNCLYQPFCAEYFRGKPRNWMPLSFSEREAFNAKAIKAIFSPACDLYAYSELRVFYLYDRSKKATVATGGCTDDIFPSLPDGVDVSLDEIAKGGCESCTVKRRLSPT